MPRITFVFLQNSDLLRDMRAIDIELIESLRDLLKPFKDVTVVMSSESSSSISLIRPLIKQLMENCDNSKVEEMPAPLHEMRQTIYNDLETR